MLWFTVVNKAVWGTIKQLLVGKELIRLLLKYCIKGEVRMSTERNVTGLATGISPTKETWVEWCPLKDSTKSRPGSVHVLRSRNSFINKPDLTSFFFSERRHRACPDEDYDVVERDLKRTHTSRSLFQYFESTTCSRRRRRPTPPADPFPGSWFEFSA